MKINWKTLAIILMTLLIIENLFLSWSVYTLNQEEEQTNLCYYNVCKDYPDADYNLEKNVCSCYDYDLLGELIVVEQEWMG